MVLKQELRRTIFAPHSETRESASSSPAGIRVQTNTPFPLQTSRFCHLIPLTPFPLLQKSSSAFALRASIQETRTLDLSQPTVSTQLWSMSTPTDPAAAQPASSDKDLDSSTSTSFVNHVEPPATSPSEKNGVPGEDEATKGEATKEEDGKEEDGPSRSPLHTALIMTALCLAVFLAALDSVIITTALPTMSRDLGASDTEFAWIGSSYLLANAASSPFWGKVSDIFGRKSILIIANVVFLVGSIVCALAYDLPMMLAGRTVQGLGGGGLITLVEIAVGDLFSQRCVTIHPI